MSGAEIDIPKNDCNGCYYYKKFMEPNIKGCHYSLIENRIRDCRVEECDKKLVLSPEEARKKNRKYWNDTLNVYKY